jgi:hypothetical protein
MGFILMGFIGFFVKLIHIPINNIIVYVHGLSDAKLPCPVSLSILACTIRPAAHPSHALHSSAADLFILPQRLRISDAVAARCTIPFLKHLCASSLPRLPCPAHCRALRHRPCSAINRLWLRHKRSVWPCGPQALPRPPCAAAAPFVPARPSLLTRTAALRPPSWTLPR